MLTNIVVACVAILHVLFLILEMFLWSKPTGLKVFGNTLERAKTTEVLAANQGLYNGFLAAGLMWGLISSDLSFIVFFLCCVIVAGIYGAYSVSRKIFYIQAMPAIVALLLTLYNSRVFFND